MHWKAVTVSCSVLVHMIWLRMLLPLMARYICSARYPVGQQAAIVSPLSKADSSRELLASLLAKVTARTTRSGISPARSIGARARRGRVASRMTPIS